MANIGTFQPFLTVGMRVTVRWGYGSSFRAQGIGTITALYPKSVRVRLLEAVPSGGWPAGFELKGITRDPCSPWDGVSPLPTPEA